MSGLGEVRELTVTNVLSVSLIFFCRLCTSTVTFCRSIILRSDCLFVCRLDHATDYLQSLSTLSLVCNAFQVEDIFSDSLGKTRRWRLALVCATEADHTNCPTVGNLTECKCLCGRAFSACPHPLKVVGWKYLCIPCWRSCACYNLLRCQSTWICVLVLSRPQRHYLTRVCPDLRLLSVKTTIPQKRLPKSRTRWSLLLFRKVNLCSDHSFCCLAKDQPTFSSHSL